MLLCLTIFFFRAKIVLTIVNIMSPKKIRAIQKKGARSGKTSLKKKMKEVRNGVRKDVQ